MSRSRSAARYVFALSVCLALAACDAQPDVRLLIYPARQLEHDCLEKLPEYLPSQVPVAEVRRKRPHKGVEYQVRGLENNISVFQDFDLNQIEVALPAQSSGSPERKRENLVLLKDVHRGVFSACNMDPAKDRVERSCSGETCKDPAYPGL